MISDARGGHVSPGVYTEERDVTYAAKTLGITSLGLAGETVKGPAFQPVLISDWAEFVDYFGGTSPEQFKATGYPKYELPYIAKSYLKESKRLYVSRALGLSGYDAGSALTVNMKVTNDESYPVVIFRSKGIYTGDAKNACDSQEYEKFVPYITGMTINGYTKPEYASDCSVSTSAYTYSITGLTATTGGLQGKYTYTYYSGSPASAITVSGTGLVNGFDITFNGNSRLPEYSGKTFKYSVSFNKSDANYIYNIFSTDPKVGPEPVYIEAVYDMAMDNKINELAGKNTKNISFEKAICDTVSNYKEYFRCAVTPWIVSEVKDATEGSMNVKKLFKFYTISDGNAANYQVKISIQNIRPDKGLFDVVVRDFYDTDYAQIVLEKFANCTMVEGEPNYLGLKIGTSDGTYPAMSKYVTVKFSDSEGKDDCVPAGFLGYPVPIYGAKKRPEMAYNVDFDFDIKPKRQFFGLNNNILDVDVLDYKGKNAYDNKTDDATMSALTKGFHLDAILSVNTSATVYVDSVEVPGGKGYFVTVNPVQNTKRYTRIPRIINNMSDSIYEDPNVRKFTVYPYGGFDGWDIYREQRTNTEMYKATNYPASAFTNDCPFRKAVSNVDDATEEGEAINLNETLDLHLPANAITSDYYAYLGAIRQFANPHDTDINVFATPGIDWLHHTLLVEDALDTIEDPDDGRGGDAIYVVTTPMTDLSGEKETPLDLVDSLEETNIDSSYACTYYPWVKYYDEPNRRYINLPVTKDVVRNMAATDNTSYPWFAPAGVSRGSVECQSACYKTTLSDEDTLYDGLINPVKSFAVDGVKIWGNKTMYSVDSPLNRVNVRRLMLRVKKLVTSAAKNLIFEQYDVTLEKQFRSLVEPILNDVKTNRGIVDYRILTECTPETRDQHILPAKIMVKPTPALEYISISFIVYPEQVSFSDEL